MAYCFNLLWIYKDHPLLCYPAADSVFLPSEDLRNEYIRNDIGLLFKGSPGSIVSRPWSFDQVSYLTIDSDGTALENCFSLTPVTLKCIFSMKQGYWTSVWNCCSWVLNIKPTWEKICSTVTVRCTSAVWSQLWWGSPLILFFPLHLSMY